MNDPINRIDPTGFADTDAVSGASPPMYESVVYGHAPGGGSDDSSTVIGGLSGVTDVVGPSPAGLSSRPDSREHSSPNHATPAAPSVGVLSGRNDDGLLGQGLIAEKVLLPQYNPGLRAFELFDRLDRQNTGRLKNATPMSQLARISLRTPTDREVLTMGLVATAVVVLVLTDGAAAGALASSKWAGLGAYFMALHHVFPQQFIEEFAEIGINAHEYTIPIETELHNLIHAANYNPLWSQFLAANRGNLTPQMAWRFANMLLSQWNLQGMPHVHY
jgi:hypothetical protein